MEQLIAIPEPVLRGILRKFKDDEDREVRTVRARYNLLHFVVGVVAIDIYYVR